ncbi:MAG TPA: sugar phosphate nucleotidyltransferase [Actinomycetota bacterium]|jgi:glucose-1-phosphate cytidylyltransferase|nr:sugar phosphate nucleotidyltransferase [Actinomycetota bacterium]
MRTVLFCGGLGLRLREHTERVPKPMVPIGYRPVLWHVMKYYAHFGHKDFVLCLGYKADVVKQYFLDYNEALSNDFVLNGNGHDERHGNHVELLSSDIHDWRITFADTGLHANVGQRLKAAQRYLDGEDVFLANYGDVLTDAPLPELIDDFLRQDKVAAFISVRPTYTFHVVSARDDGVVERIDDVRVSDIWINGGYMILRKEIFDYIGEGEELVQEPFQRLIKQDLLLAYRYEGFWAPMDTLKDQQDLEAQYEAGNPAWAVWQR